MGSFKAVIFDCDGTLVDSEHAHCGAWAKVLQNHNVDLSWEDYLYCVGMPDLKCAHYFAEKLNFEQPLQMLEQKNGYFQELQEEGLPQIEHTVEFLRRLALEKERLNLKIGLASAAIKDDIMRNVKHLGIEDVLDVILSGVNDLLEYSDPEGVNKPKPYIYLHAAKMLGVSPEQCVVIEDSRTGVSAGVSAGCITVAIPNPVTQQHDLSHAHLKVESLQDVSVDDFFKIVHTARQV